MTPAAALSAYPALPFYLPAAAPFPENPFLFPRNFCVKLAAGKESGMKKDRCFPRRFLQDLESYAKENPGTIIIKKYDMKSDKEIPYEG